MICVCSHMECTSFFVCLGMRIKCYNSVTISLASPTHEWRKNYSVPTILYENANVWPSTTRQHTMYAVRTTDWNNYTAHALIVEMYTHSLSSTGTALSDVLTTLWSSSLQCCSSSSNNFFFIFLARTHTHTRAPLQLFIIHRPSHSIHMEAYRAQAEMIVSTVMCRLADVIISTNQSDKIRLRLITIF